MVEYLALPSKTVVGTVGILILLNRHPLRIYTGILQYSL